VKDNISGFRGANLSEEEVQRILKRNEARNIKTGHYVIDDVFGGIKQSDVLLIGAKTGIGKTELCSEIAMHMAAKGKRVFMFALEAEDREIELRILFKRLAAKSSEKLIYKKWYDNQYKNLPTKEALGETHFNNLNVYYREKDFTTEEFVRSTMAIKEKADIIIIDHIHYFDFEGKNENQELSRAVRKIRDMALLANIPIILVAHLRKEVGQAKEAKLIPDIDDFMGSSDLPKVCTKAIIMGQGRVIGDDIPTLFYFPKFRQFGAAKNFLFICQYNTAKQVYSDEYKTYYFRYNSPKLLEELELVDEKYLDWLG